MMTRNSPAATPSLVAHISAESADTVTIVTSAINTSGATFLVVSLATFGTTATGTFSDSKSNTWVPLTRRGSSITVDVQMWACYSPTVGTGHTFSYDTTPNGSYASMEVLAFSGITTSAINASNGATTLATMLAQSGSITPSVGNTLVIAGLGINANTGGSISINGGYTITDTVAYGSNFGSSAAYLVLTSASAQNPTWTSANSATSLTAAIAAFAY